jgi:outer membrane protein assembly factor BamA
MTGSLRTRWRAVATAVAFILLWGSAQAAVAIEYQITDIRISGNEKTHREILLRELGFSAGMTVSGTVIEKGRKSIMALGLFTTVKTRLQPTKIGHRLWVHVREKYFFLPVPIVHLSGDGDWTYGVMSQTDNLLGLNQQLKAMFRHKVYHDADIEREDRLQIRYQTPRISNSLFGLELGLYRERALLDEVRQKLAGSYERRITGGDITVSRWLRASGPSRGWRLSVGLQQQAYEHTLLSGDTGLLFNASVFTVLARLENKMITVSADRRRGHHYGYELQKIIPGAGRTINRNFGFYRSYQNLGFGDAAQLHTHLRMGACSGSVFGNPCFSLGGDTTIRGIGRDTLEGDVFVLSNVQLLIPLADTQYIRGVVFLDAGVVADSMYSVTPYRSAAGVGAGLVWKMKRFVRTDVRVELAHGLGANGGNRVYAATSMLF